MAKSKKKSATSAKKSSKKKSVARHATQVPRLSAAEKAGLLKPGEDLDEILADVASAWRRVARQVRVAGLTPAKIESLSRKALRAAQKEQALAAKQADRLAPLSDTRMRTADEAYRAALKIKRVADAMAETDPAVADAFAKVNERFRRARPPGDASGGA